MSDATPLRSATSIADDAPVRLYITNGQEAEQAIGPIALEGRARVLYSGYVFNNSTGAAQSLEFRDSVGGAVFWAPKIADNADKYLPFRVRSPSGERPSVKVVTAGGIAAGGIEVIVHLAQEV